MAASPEDVSSQVIVTLACDEENAAPFHTRTLLLDRSKPVASMGRASKVSSKGFVAGHDNAWFESPVVSRKHAEISADFDQQKVYIRDIGSLHGTFFNTMEGGSADMKLNRDELQELSEGDKITLGMDISRNNQAFTPTRLRVGITHNLHGAGDRNTASRSTFAVPVDDDSSSDEDTDYPALLSPQAKASTNHHTVVDLTGTSVEDNVVNRTVGEVIDLTSPAQPLSPATPGNQDRVNWFPHCLDVPSRDMSNRPPSLNDHSRHEDSDVSDDELAHGYSDLMDDEESSIGSLSDGKSVSSGYSSDDDDNSFLAAEIESTMMESANESDDEDEDESGLDSLPDDESDRLSHHGSLDFAGDYSSDDDVINPDDPDTAIWGASPGPLDSGYMRASPMPALIQPTLLRVNSIESLLNHKAAADPYRATDSPHTSNRDDASPGLVHEPATSAYITAREENRVKAVPTPMPESLPNLATLAASVGVNVRSESSLCDRPEGPAFPRSLNEFVPITKEGSTNNGGTHTVAGENAPKSRDAVPRTLDKISNLAASALRQNEQSSLLKTGDDFLTRPYQPSAVRTGLQSNKSNGDDEDTATSAHDLWSRKIAQDQDAGNGQGLNTLQCRLGQHDERLKVTYLCTNLPSATPLMCDGPPGKGKRKADDISTLTAAEKKWELMMVEKINAGAAAHLAALKEAAKGNEDCALPKDDTVMVDAPEEPPVLGPTTAVIPSQMEIETPVQMPAAAPAPAQAPNKTGFQPQAVSSARTDTEMRPAKRQRIKNIAERLGYAALGGVSVGAAIVTTLIYTAPTF